MTDAELSDAIYRSIGYLRGLASSDRCPSQDRADLLGIAEEVEELANRFFYGEEPGAFRAAADIEASTSITAQVEPVGCPTPGACSCIAEIERLKAEIRDSVDSGDAERKWLRAEVARLNESHEWIPCSERMPTAEDGDINGEVLWLVSRVDNDQMFVSLSRWNHHHFEFRLSHWRPTGITELPQPPAEPEKPKRRRGRIRKDYVGKETSPYSYIDVPVLNGEMDVVEVLPGDPDIDACRQFLDMLESRCGDGELTTVPFPARELREWVRKCKGVK